LCDALDPVTARQRIVRDEAGEIERVVPVAGNRRRIPVRPGAQGGALLRAGQGSDVAPGTAPVTVKRWAKKRVEALLARFGQ